MPEVVSESVLSDELDASRTRSRGLGGTPIRINLLVSGSYAWLTTVAAPVWLTASDVASRVTSLGALVALVAGLLLTARSARWGRAVTLGGFVGLSAATWVLLGPLLAADRIEPVRSALGAVGWTLFAFGWGAVRDPGRIPENDPRVIRSTPLTAKGGLPPFAQTVFAIAVVGAALPWFLAWRVVREEHALLAQSLALIASLSLIWAGAKVAVERRQTYVVSSAVSRLNRASASLAGLVILGMLGLVVWMLGR